MLGALEILVLFVVFIVVLVVFAAIFFVALRKTNRPQNPNPTSSSARLDELTALLNAGKIDENEYQAQRKRILEEI